MFCVSHHRAVKLCAPLQEKVLVSVWSRRTDADMLAGARHSSDQLGFWSHSKSAVVCRCRKRPLGRLERPQGAAAIHRHHGQPLSRTGVRPARPPFSRLSGPRELPPGRGPVSRLARWPQPHRAGSRERARRRRPEQPWSSADLIHFRSPHSTHPTCQPSWTSGRFTPWKDPGSAPLRLTHHSTSASSARARNVCSG